MSRQSALPIAALLMLAGAFLSCPALAGIAPMAWDKCYADGGTDSKLFSCDLNDAAPQVLVVSFQLDLPMLGFIAVDGTVDVLTPEDETDQTFPTWWQFYNPGACRQQALTVDADFSAIPQGKCKSAWNGPTYGGIGFYSFPNTHSAQLIFGVAVATPETLVARRDYLACRLVIHTEGTIGPGSCAGCGRPMCIRLNQLNAYGPGTAMEGCSGETGWEYDYPSTVGWNCGYLGSKPSSYYPGYYYPACMTTSGCAPTPARNRTWGQLKAMYR